jgi:ATP-binding cassette subfamily B protein
MVFQALRSHARRLRNRNEPGGEELLDVEAGGNALAKASDAAPKREPRKQAFWVEHKEQLWELAPFLWPKGELKLRLSIVAAFLCLLIAKAFNVCVPIAMKHAVDDVAAGRFPLGPVIAYGCFRFLTDATKELRDSLFAQSSAYATRQISLRVFNHVQTLSLRFHLNRKTGAVLRAVSRGSQSFADLLRYLSFQIAPIFLEVGVVSTYLFIRYDFAFGLITICVMASYVALTITVTEWRNQFRRRATEAEDAFSQQAVDALLNFETVLLFNAESHISGVYDKSLASVADASVESQLSLSLLNVVQNAVISFGCFLALYLAGQRVVKGSMTVGDFVLVQAFILQLYAPLGFLGTYWRMIKSALVDVESMFKLMKEEHEIKDIPGAQELLVSQSMASVTFEKVVFTFEPTRGPLLKGLSLEALSGKKLAIVGSSGAGKSTLARLLFRLYNVDSGRVLIGGVDIAQCTQRSVRCAVAIVPQDTVLFNDTLRYNVSIGKLARGELASEAEVLAAAHDAQLTDFLSKQPLGLDTVVGERGLRLSGGEKQRVGLARAFVKNSPVFVGDESTAALDSHTEGHIMEAMDRAATGRTYLVIAHRLSTVANADAIAVLHEGVIAELGTHAELLAKGPDGLYASLWAKHAQESASAAESDAVATPMPPAAVSAVAV